jgi:hypothetical protein
MNNGLSDELKLAFPKFKPIARPTIINEGIFDPYWLVGFVDGEGSFYVNTKKSSSKLGFQIILVFSIYQHSRDTLLLQNLIKFLPLRALRCSALWFCWNTSNKTRFR